MYLNEVREQDRQRSRGRWYEEVVPASATPHGVSKWYLPPEVERVPGPVVRTWGVEGLVYRFLKRQVRLSGIPIS